jgi:hypothetical protein
MAINPWTKNKSAKPKVVEEDANFPSLLNATTSAATATSSYASKTTNTNKMTTKTFFSDKEENNDLKPGWVYISWANKNGANGENGANGGLNGAQAPYTYIYGPDVFNAYLEDCFVREERSDYIWRRRVWRHHNHINRENATLGDLSPYWNSTKA